MVNVIPCPKCETPLMVPPGANGRRARCPACRHRFVISLKRDLLEDTVSNWIMKDVEEIFEGDCYEESESVDTGRGPASPATGSPGGPSPSYAGGGSVTTASVGLGDSTIIGVPVIPQSAGDDHNHDSTCGSCPGMNDNPQSSHLSKQATADTGEYESLKPDYERPYLAVLKCSNAGVLLAFEHHWLKHEGFRASMPQRCIACGSTRREQFIARPMLFVDQCQGSKQALEQINALHENRMIGDHSRRDIMRQMGMLEKLPSPFHYAMPYYVSTHHARLAMLCRTRDHTGGRISCEVLVPDHMTALEWLANVNGVCGPGYEKLERNISLMHGQGWQSLTETCRQRLSGWCKFLPQETFIMYVSDADFGKCDLGMAGVIITDQRVILRKYHHRGQVRRDNKHATIYIQSSGMFASLKILIGEEQSRTIKILGHEVDALAGELRKSSGLDVIVC